MNDRQTAHPPISVGILTILMILVVLLLTSFAVMSLLSANADANLTDKACASVHAYYAADSQAERMVAEIDAALTDDDWQKTLSSIGASVDLGDVSVKISFFVPIDGQNCLFVVLKYPLEDGRPAGSCERNIWQKTAPEEAVFFDP